MSQESALSGLFGSFARLRGSSTQAPQKVVQTLMEGAVVVRLGARLTTIVFDCPCPLAVVENTTARMLRHLQILMSHVTKERSKFRRRLRCVTTDAYAPNLACERPLWKLRKCDGSHFLCDFHNTSRAHAKSLSPLGETVTGLIRTALSLRTGGAMVQLRQCLRGEIASRVVLRHGCPPAEAVQHKL